MATVLHEGRCSGEGWLHARCGGSGCDPQCVCPRDWDLVVPVQNGQNWDFVAWRERSVVQLVESELWLLHVALCLVYTLRAYMRVYVCMYVRVYVYTHVNIYVQEEM
jgi:hypothetical protein